LDQSAAATGRDVQKSTHVNSSVRKITVRNHAVSWSFSRSDCNGKEKDYESGFHYYGARYYWSELLTGWLSVDPMADKYPSMSPYAYCAWNPVMLVDPDGKDVEIVKNSKNKTVTIRANFYYNREQLGPEADVFLSGFKDAVNSWSNDIQRALKDESLGAVGYGISFEFNYYERENPKESAKNDAIGNSLSNDPNYYGTTAEVTDCKHLTTNLRIHSRGDNPDAYDNLFYGTTECQGTLKHEIGHFFGLYDRYPEAKNPAPTILNDLMDKHIETRGNAEEPFKRLWKCKGLDSKDSQKLLINIKNREIW
jgi:RHS repeat-associated protein